MTANSIEYIVKSAIRGTVLVIDLFFLKLANYK